MNVDSVKMLIKKKITCCKVCNKDSFLYDVVDFNKSILPSFYIKDSLSGIPIYYYKCTNCDFIFTKDFDNYSDTEWNENIYNEDYFKLLDTDYEHIRPEYHSRLIKKIIGKDKMLFQGLDYGGGNGELSKLLNEEGIYFHSYDPFNYQSVNINTKKKFNLLTCFEVLEHTPNPIKSIEELMSFSDNNAVYIISTQLSDNYCNDATRCNWSYIAPRNGHISIYAKKTISFIAKKYGLNHCIIGNGLHIFSKSSKLKHFKNRATIFKIQERIRPR